MSKETKLKNAWWGDSFEDAIKRRDKGENNEFTAGKLQKMFEAGGVEKSKVEELIGPPTKLYALHICHKNCERTDNSDVGGGSVTFVKAKYDGNNKVRTEYFARLTGGSTTSCEKLCAMEIPIKSDEPDKRNISLKNPRLDSELKLRISRDKIEIEDSLVEISHWPRRINDQDKNQIIDFLENQIGNKVSPDSMKISLSQKFDTGINGNRLYKYEKNPKVNLSLRCFGDNSLRIFHCNEDELMLSAQSRLGYFREWKGDGTFEKDYFYDRRKLLLIWVPNLTQPVVGNDLKGRCPVVILDRIKRIEKQMGTYFHSFTHQDYEGFFIFIGDRNKGYGNQIPIIHPGGINKLVEEIQTYRRSKKGFFPLYRFRLSTRNLELSWLEKNKLIAKQDSGIEHNLKSDNGEIHLMLTSQELEEDLDFDKSKFIHLKLRNENDDVVFEIKSKISNLRSNSISLRIGKMGNYRLIIRLRSDLIRIVNLNIVNNSVTDNSIFCENKGWTIADNINEDDIICGEPNAHKKLMTRILNKKFPKLKDFVDYNKREWLDKKNRQGLMMEINRAVFQELSKDGPVNSSSWTKRTNLIYSAVETLNWPNLGIDEKIITPEIGVLQTRGGEFFPESIGSYNRTKWITFQNNNNINEKIGGWGIIYSDKTFKQLINQGGNYEKIIIDHESGIRFGLPKNQGDSYLRSIKQQRNIFPTAVDFLRDLWTEVEDFHNFSRSNRRKLRYSPSDKSEDNYWSMEKAFPWRHQQNKPLQSDEIWESEFHKSMGIDINFNQNSSRKRKQLFLELNYYYSGNNEEYPNDRMPAELYLGCLYDDNGLLSEKKVLIGTTETIRDNRDQLMWIDIDQSTVGKNNISQLTHLLHPINGFSDSNYITREVIRAFRTIYERENQIISDKKTLTKKYIPNWLLYCKNLENNGKDFYMPELKINAFIRCMNKESGKNMSVDDRKIIEEDYVNNILKEFWWD